MEKSEPARCTGIRRATMKIFLDVCSIICISLIFCQMSCAATGDGGKPVSSSADGGERSAIIARTIASLPTDAVRHGPAATRDGGEYYTWTRGDMASPTLELLVWETLKDGEAIELFVYKNDKKDGIQRLWYPGGQLKEEAHYEGGERHGITRRWDTKGQLIARFEMGHG